jgi:tetratricopeptide (TPR) repeat protein
MPLPGRFQRFVRLSAVVFSLGLLVPSLPNPLFAQSGAQYRQWLEWCRSIGGTPSGTPSRPVCIPGGAPPVQGPTPEQLRQEAARAKHDEALRHWDRKDWDVVIRLLEEALALWPDNQAYAENLRKARENRDNQRRSEAYRRAFRAGNEAFDQRRWRDAIGHYREALANFPNDPAALKNIQLAEDRLREEQMAFDREQWARTDLQLANSRLQEVLGPPRDVAVTYSTLQALAGRLYLEGEATDANIKRVEAVLQVIATHWAVQFPHVTDAMQRDVVIRQSVKELEDLLKDTLVNVTTLMIADAARLKPFFWNPFGAEQRVTIARMEREIAEARRRAEIEIGGGALRAADSGTGSATILYEPGPAMKQLRTIRREMIWNDQ